MNTRQMLISAGKKNNAQRGKSLQLTVGYFLPGRVVTKLRNIPLEEEKASAKALRQDTSYVCVKSHKEATGK